MKCPLCGCDVHYEGLTSIECDGASFRVVERFGGKDCPNFKAPTSPALRDALLPPAPGSWAWAMTVKANVPIQGRLAGLYANAPDAGWFDESALHSADVKLYEWRIRPDWLAANPGVSPYTSPAYAPKPSSFTGPQPIARP